MSNTFTKSDDIIDVLVEGDNRPLPSTKVIQNVPAPKQQVMAERTDEEVFTEVESNLRTVIDFGQQAIQSLSDLAYQSEHPRPYEALSTLIKSVTDANVSLANMRKKDKISKDNRFQEPEKQGTMITASVSDLLDEIDRKTNEK